MQLMIIHNPHSQKPDELREHLQREAGQSYIEQVEPDRNAMRDLQQLLSPGMKKE